MIEDKRIARAALILGYPVSQSGLVVCEQQHIGTEYGRELFKLVDSIAKNYPYIFIDLLAAKSMTPTNADRLARKEHFLALKNRVRLVLVDPTEELENTIYEGRRQNGLSPGMSTIYTINPNPRVRIKA